MDKETLSNYGWIVILVLILAVMIAFASPFGNFIAGAIKSTTAGLFGVNQNALGASGIVIPGQEFDNAIPNTQDTPLNPTGKFPEGIANGDTYAYSDYVYTYNEEQTGWYVALNLDVTDKTKETYGEILESIDGYPIINVDSLFSSCSNLITAPLIPDTVTSMQSTFGWCSKLATYVGSIDENGNFSNYALPKNLTNMNGTFRNTTIVIAPKLPNGVTNMSYAFANCKSLTTMPIIPNTVVNLSNTFSFCENLVTYHGNTNSEGDLSKLQISSNVKYFDSTFKYCAKIVCSPDLTNATAITDMQSAFKKCTELITPPSVIHSNVLSLLETFNGCTKLKGTIEINTDHIYHNNQNISGGGCQKCFYGVNMNNVTLTGSASISDLNLIGSTGNNWTTIK